VAFANALQLETARCRSVPLCFNFVDCAKFEVAQPISCHLRAFLLLIRYATLWPWTLTPWPWPLTFVVCRLCRSQSLYEIWAQSWCDVMWYDISVLSEEISLKLQKYSSCEWALLKRCWRSEVLSRVKVIVRPNPLLQRKHTFRRCGVEDYLFSII